MDSEAVIRNIAIALCIVALTGCFSAGGSINYTRMSDSELKAFNEERPDEQKVYCVEENRLGSHIVRRECKELSEWRKSRNLEDGSNSIQLLEILNVR